MGIFFVIDQKLINFESLTDLVQDKYRSYFGRPELTPYILSELCALDMLYAVTMMKDGYYKDRLVLKGGHSVRNHVPLVDHRFSFDADFNTNSYAKFSFGTVDEIKKDLMDFGSSRRCQTRTEITQNTSMLYFLEVKYRDELRKMNQTIIEPPKIEICKTCRTIDEPTINPMNTMIDLALLGLKPPVLAHLSLEEQLANKLYVIGSNSRQRDNFDAYDVYRICINNKINWKKTKDLFQTIVEKSEKRKLSSYVDECRRKLDTMLENQGKQDNLVNVLFNPQSFSFNDMVSFVKTKYDFN